MRTRPGHARLLLPLSIAVAVSPACRPEHEPTPPPNDGGDETGEDEAAGDAATCGPAGERFRDLTWIPPDSRFVAWTALGHPDFDAAAEHLAAVAGTSDRIEPALPIYASTDLGQLGFELSSLGTTLAFAGFSPAELIKLHGPGGVPVYVWPTTCDLDLARTRLEAAYGVAMRKVVDGMVGTPQASEFPFDVLLLRGDRAAFVPRDKAPLVLDWLGAGAAPTLSGEPSPPPGVRLREVEAAPFRILLQGDSLAAGAGAAASGVRILRATAAGVEIDGRLAAPS